MCPDFSWIYWRPSGEGTPPPFNLWSAGMRSDMRRRACCWQSAIAGSNHHEVIISWMLLCSAARWETCFTNDSIRRRAIDNRRLLETIIMRYLFQESCYAPQQDGERFSQMMAKSKAKTWKSYPKCMRDRSDAKQSFPGGALFRSVGKTHGFSNSTRRKRPPQSDGFEAILGTETSSCTRCW